MRFRSFVVIAGVLCFFTGTVFAADTPRSAHAEIVNAQGTKIGTATFVPTAKGATLGEGANSLFHDGGTSIVIHAKQDDLMSDPSGNSGDRIACGVIEK
ncbi:MAG TPA: superoxide dismutase family protein [Terracidiphilus sp.]|nr:superoxide dismutase family protein [Terracidiphilus sp.]